MQRIEINCMTGESVVIPRAAYKDAQGNVFILDVGASTEGLTELTESELLAYSAPPPLTKAQREAALLAPYKLNRPTVQLIIGIGELDARLKASTDGTTYEAELADTYTRNKTYRTARLLENEMLSWT